MRSLFALGASGSAKCDLQRLISYDYLMVHSGDAGDSVNSLHPAVPYRGAEWLVKRDVVRSGLELMFSRELLDKRLDSEGIFYAGNALTSAFIALLKSPYALGLKVRAEWVVSRFGQYSDDALEQFMTHNIGRWGAEFEQITALNDLELE